MSELKRATINGGFFSFIIAAVGFYQGENLLTSIMVWGFAWVIMALAFWLSYRLTRSKAEKQ
jgi:multisubunit Na+/H+ antiporter MnhE subunit